MTDMDKVWQRVKLARSADRPTSKSLIKAIFPDFIELHGDRLYGDDEAIVGGLATFNDIPVTVIAEEKGTDTQNRLKHNFGMPHPEGYRKALRLMKQAEKFKRPIITIIDTPGAYPGLGAEERGQAGAIALNLKELMVLKTPIIVIVLGEGGSGGALAIGVGDHIMMFENAIYSILSPEGFASILFKDSTRANEAAHLMKLTAEDLKSFGIIDEIILEGKGLNTDPEVGYTNLKKQISKQLTKLMKTPVEKLLVNRYDKFKKMGEYEESVIKNEELAD
ncbi:acetyl-CoA carboxylase carboxyltransferase subunit alpha [Acholeplasma laidlawii]|jgi:acetyl-CoA carboxylase carboxyl transferase subunit alpha|uniref:Acetyl-coenzyme A carboxylase carboxyl transferase subunit alpha n=2 Tax=Acholeplasma laidlawii TaxID=2148 RepID=A9NFE9_ACHLI|nr:acetyl-CoA carboxylase carboxyltransferase subunit alpha [Acholeplasma laidlawii]ABX81079.1 acetyl-CoA carboxylase, alpha subunit [Acholeplasma laidlawii PG-8A]MBG0762658.1 acetyl-CoA carboxylase carboxyltransferase subunit alpha [Acholeplasma laidlawii]NWH10354.1 acetyl-CoA carboxylase carboxyltransferase subunit alpha [Acholeplasma laidlawii]NWH11743.1 acetyl-CoA carboxylase carboxyltransferase subunit alpha [Acholeplasma laidlawii]NWH12849.1 acetyl-CoA carboxylase carboxyltransferase sub